jgi:cell division protein FtsB
MQKQTKQKMRTNNMKRISLSRQAGTRTRLRKQRNILFVALVASLALIAWLIFGNTNPVQNFTPMNTSIQKNIQSGNQIHTARMEQLQQHENYLQEKVQDFKEQSNKAQADARYLRQQIQFLTFRTQLNPIRKSDTLQKLADCESLQEQVSELISTEQYKDSIVNMQVSVYEDLITAKDSTITTWSEDYRCLRMQTDTLMQLNKNLNAAYKKTVRQANRAKRWNKITGGLALLVTAGFTATQLYRR